MGKKKYSFLLACLLMLSMAAGMTGCAKEDPRGAQLVAELEKECGDVKTKEQLDELSDAHKMKLFAALALAQNQFVAKQGNLSLEEQEKLIKARDRAIKRSEYKDVLTYFLLENK
jgi:hypothetical protein